MLHGVGKLKLRRVHQSSVAQHISRRSACGPGARGVSGTGKVSPEQVDDGHTGRGSSGSSGGIDGPGSGPRGHCSKGV